MQISIERGLFEYDKMGRQLNLTAKERANWTRKSASQPRDTKEEVSATCEAFNASPCLGLRMHDATLKDLCEEDKQKVARLIRQVVSLTKEKEALESAASAEHARQAVVVDALQEQNRQLLAEVTSLRLKLLQAHGHLRTYQLKLRALKDGVKGEIVSPLESPLGVSPPLSASNTLVPHPASDQIEAPLSAPSSSEVAHFGPPAPQATVLIDLPAPLGFTTTSVTAHPAPVSPNAQLGKELVGVDCVRLASSGAAAAVVSPGGGVWAAWTELEQRIRSVTGELAQRGRQGEPLLHTREPKALEKLQTGDVRGETANPVSLSPGVARNEQPVGAASAVACTSFATQSGTSTALVQEGASVRPTDSLGAPNGGPLLTTGPTFPQQTHGSRVSASPSIAGGPVVPPRPVVFPNQERPLFPPPSNGFPGGALPSVQPSVAVPPSAPSPPVPTAAPTLPEEAPPDRQSEGGLPLPTAGMAQAAAVGPTPGLGASLLNLVDRHQLPLDTNSAQLGASLGGPRRGSLEPDRHVNGEAALLAAVVESDLATLDQGRAKWGETDRWGSQRGAEAESHRLSREEPPRLLRFDPTVGEAGAFFYVDVRKEDEATSVDQASKADRRGPGEARAGASSGEAERDCLSSKITPVCEGNADDVDRMDNGDEQSAEIDSAKPHRSRAADRVSMAELPNPKARQLPQLPRQSMYRQPTLRDHVWSSEASLSSPVHERGRARWVSGMLYDSALVELVEELEMEHGRKDRGERVEGFPVTWARGMGAVLVSPKGKQPDKGRGRPNQARHLRGVHLQMNPEVLILSNG